MRRLILRVSVSACLDRPRRRRAWADCPMPAGSVRVSEFVGPRGSEMLARASESNGVGRDNAHPPGVLGHLQQCRRADALGLQRRGIGGAAKVGFSACQRADAQDPLPATLPPGAGGGVIQLCRGPMTPRRFRNGGSRRLSFGRASMACQGSGIPGAPSSNSPRRLWKWFDVRFRSRFSSGEDGCLDERPEFW
jgi:hypothetical protein